MLLTYVGQTGRHLHIRIHEHLGVSSITGNQIKTSSSIYEHIQQTGHWADNTCFLTCSFYLWMSNFYLHFMAKRNYSIKFQFYSNNYKTSFFCLTKLQMRKIIGKIEQE